MSRDLSNSDWLERNLESARRRVNQLEIDACKIRTDLARLEVANASGIVDSVAPELRLPVAIGGTEPSLDWQPAAELVPDGMEILVGETPAVEAPLAADHLDEDVAS